jgi:hypothetical protein
MGQRLSLGQRSLFSGALAAIAAVALAGCSAESGSSASSAKSGAAATAPMASASGVGGPAVMRRLTEAQYRQIITDVFGDTIKLGGRFEPDIRVEHLVAVGAGQASVTAAGLEQYDKIARSVGDQVVDADHRSQMIPCKPASDTAPDAACAKLFLGKVGRQLFRRPLTQKELQSYVDSSAAATMKVNDFYKGISLGVAGMLEAPQFLYRQEFSEADPAHKGQLRLTGYSKATRLSFFLWNTAPDPALLDAAEKGELHTAKGTAKQVERMLASPRLESGVRAFFTDMLEFDSFDVLAKDAALYPKFTFAAAAQAQEQTLRTIVDHLVTSNGDYRDLFTTRKTFLTPLLGSLYRVAVLAPDGLPDAWVPFEFKEANGQAGILTHASFVALHSHPGRTSPTLRGKALREVLLCQKVPDPPGNVNFNLVQDTTNPQYKTVRQRLTAHATEAMCTGCHKITDPMGLALENFDTIGGFRTDENGAKIDASGELDGVKFTSAAGLGQAVHDNPRTVSCLVKQAYAYGVGRSATKSEEEWRTNTLEKAFAADGYRLPALLRRIAMSDTFFRVVPPEAEGNAPTVASAEK